MKRKILKQVEKANPDETRLILLSVNYFFNKLASDVRHEKNQIKRSIMLSKLTEALSIRGTILETFIELGRFELNNLDVQQGLHYVYGTLIDKQIIDQDGIYIKIELGRSDTYYKGLIKKARAELTFVNSPAEDQEKFLSEKGNFSIKYLDNKKAPKHRKQHGYNNREDMEIYLECEKQIKNVFTAKAPEGLSNYDKKEYENKIVKDALETAALDVKKDTTRIYYEVCRRYKLPTFKDYSLVNKIFQLIKV